MLSRDLESLSDSLLTYVIANAALDGEALLHVTHTLDEMAKRARALEALPVPDEAKVVDLAARRRPVVLQLVGGEPA
ncbi:MAG: hypothetical protein U1E45_14880 [Geminicoccaceae bacterium]